MFRVALLCIVAALCVAAAPLSSISPTDADRAAFMRGVVAQREIDIFQNPRSCGAVLLRARCQSDIATAIPHGVSSGAPLSTEFAKTGDLSSFDSKLHEINHVDLLMDQEWAQDPRGAWLRTAGAAYVLITGEDDSLHESFDAFYLGDLVTHLEEAGPYLSLVPQHFGAIAALAASQNTGAKSGNPPLDPAQALELGTVIAPALAKLFPIGADPAIAFSQTPSGEARVGVASATVNELFESPVVLMEPQSRAFLESLSDFELAHGAVVPGWDRARFDNVVLSGQSSAALTALYTAEHQLGIAYVSALPRVAAKQFLFGLVAAQGAYNAAVLREKPFDLTVRSLMAGDLARNDATVPEAAAPRAAFLRDSQPGQWVTENARLSDLTMAIVAAK